MSTLQQRSAALYNSSRARGVWLAAAISSLSGLAAAEEPSRELKDLEEVIVTAQKRSERLQDVPVPVTTVNAEMLTDHSQVRVQDYYTQIPGLALAMSGAGSAPVIAIRGITTGGASNPTVGVVIDEVSYGASAATGVAAPLVPDIDPGDLARVEVLRGPQGTLYGAASMGGLLKFATVDPSLDSTSGRVQAGSTTVSHSNDAGYSARGSVNLPLGSTLAIRASGFTLRDPGYIDNAETGQRDVNRRDSSGARLSALWRPSEAFTAKISGMYQDSKRLGTDDVDSSLGDDPKLGFVRGSGFYKRKSEVLSATLVGDLGGVELTSATGFSRDKIGDDIETTVAFGGFFVPYATMFGVDRAVTENRTTVEKFSQELRASIPLSSHFTWLIGAFYTDEDTSFDVDNQAVNGATGQRVGSFYKTAYRGTFKEHAGFTNLTWTMSDQWDLQIGGRYSRNKQSYPIVKSGQLILDFFGRDPDITPELRADDSATTYLITPRFKISPDLMAYARFATGYRPGGPNINCGVAGVPCKFEADTTQNFDLGLKGDVLDHMLSFDASLYYIRWKDIQIPGIQVPPFYTYTGNVSGAKSEGVELTLGLTPGTGLTLSTWLAYNNAELTRAFPPGLLFGEPGDRLPYSSRFSGSVSIEQTFQLTASAQGFVGGSLSYVGDRKGIFQPTSTRQTFPGYAQLDVHGGVSFGAWSLNLFVNNATDRQGVLRGGLDSELYPTWFVYTRPRTIGMSLSRTF